MSALTKQDIRDVLEEYRNKHCFLSTEQQEATRDIVTLHKKTKSIFLNGFVISAVFMALGGVIGIIFLGVRWVS